MFGIKSREQRHTERTQERFPLYPFDGIYQDPPLQEHVDQAAEYLRVKMAEVSRRAIAWDGTYVYMMGSTLPDRRLTLPDQRIARALHAIIWQPTEQELALKAALEA